MKLTFLFCFCGIMWTSASVYSQQKKVTLDMKNARLSAVFDELKKQTDLDFFYNARLKNSDQRVSVQASDKELEEVLSDLLTPLNLECYFDQELVIIREKSAIPQQQPRSRVVRGTVTDAAGVPLPGVTVRLEGTTTGTATRPDGTYSLTLPGDIEGTLLFSSVGFRPVGRELRYDEPLDVRMEEAIEELADVVVTGIFNKPKESYTGAVSVITSQQLELYRAQNLLQTLRSIDASLFFVPDNENGSDPNTRPQITIRGEASLPLSVEEVNVTNQGNAVNAPLVIMDGFEISLEKLMDYNDEEISSINILKDAAATAIYGSRGANGVIVIISKQPRAGALKFNVELGMTVEAPDLTSYNLLDAAGKLELERRLGLYGDVTTELDTRYKKTYNDRLRAVLSGVNTDWLSKPLHAGHGVAGNLRLEGGSEEFRWSATGSWRDTRGAMKGSARQNFNAGITLAYTVDNLIFRNNASVTVNRATNSPYGAFSTYARQQPYNSPRDENGNITRLFDGFYAGISQETGNPLYDATLKSFNKNGYLSLTDNFSIEWHPVESLRARGSFGITTRNHTSDVFTSAEHSRFTSNTSDDADVFLRRGTYAFTTGNDNSYSGNATVSYTKILADRHQLYAAIDYSMRVNASYAYHFNLEGFSSEEMSFPGNARQYQQDGKPGGLQSRTTSLGVTANVNYTYLRRYYADLSYRVDGSSSFGNERQFAPFWSAGVGWNLHGEKFMERQSLFNSLRLRLSYGITGSQQDMTSALTTYRYDTDNKYMSWTGTTLEGWGNPKLTWQNTGSFNFGLEWSAWDGLFKGDLNVYTRKTNNLLSSLALPASMGFTSHAANIGSVRNSGWELSASAYLARDHVKRFIWIVTGQLVHNTNKILELSEAVKAQNEAYILAGGDVSTLFYEGRPQSGLYAVRSLGVDPSTGREIFLDRDGAITPTWNAGDKVYLGSKTPLYRGKASTMLQYKGLTFNLAINYYWGGKTYNRTLLDKVEVTTYTIQTGNVDARVLGARWANPGDHTFFPRVSNVATRATSRFVMDDNTLEISSIALQYRWDGRWVRERARVNSINFGLNVSAPDGLVRWSTIKMERGTSYPYAYNMQGSIKLLF